MKRLAMMIPPMPFDRPQHRPGEGERVVLLHGLWRSHRAMEPLAKRINESGFETLNVPYPSFRASFDRIVEQVAAAIGESERPTHFVTHSMGGIVVRHLAARFPERVTGQVIMLAPPNQGSEIIDWLERFPFSRWALGPGGMSLSTREVRETVPGFTSDREVSVLMGNCDAMPVFKRLLAGESDGVVTVSGGEVEGMTRLEVFNADHTFIMGEEEVEQRVLELLGNPVSSSFRHVSSR